MTDFYSKVLRLVGGCAALAAASIAAPAAAAFDCTSCVFDPQVGSYDFDYTVPPTGLTYRWTMSYTSADPDAYLTLDTPNQTEIFYSTRAGDLTDDQNPPFRFDQNVAPGRTTIIVRAPRAFDFCAEPGPSDEICAAEVHIWGNGTMIRAFGNAPIIANFSESLVPEPATWALMIGGFGLVGVRMRAARTLAQR